ncbi:MAG: DUF1385 domain-containing protein [Actinobacteria bacterium]|nr:DUF1385 domain-containing protein [Actinomycetota bacterium]
MDAALAQRILGQADASDSLPRLGGMARSNGVVIVSERFWAFADRDGAVHEGAMPLARGRLGHLRRLPFLRGLVRLAASLAPLFRGRGVASRRERALVGAAVLSPFLLFLLPPALERAAWLAVTAGLLAWLVRGRTLNLHGAEHRAIGAAEHRRLLDTWSGSARPSRFSLRCGTNFAALVLPVSVLAEVLWPLPWMLWTPFAVTLLSLALTMELWELVQGSPHATVKGLLLPGLGLQRMTTREPSLAETQLALVAVASVLRREAEGSS